MRYIYILIFLPFLLFGESYVGEVVAIEGTVFKKSPIDQNYKTVVLNDKLFQGDEIRTSNQGKVKILFIDDSIVHISSKSNFSVEKYSVDQKNQQRSVSLRLVSGKMRSWVHSVFNKQSTFELKTPTSTVGVRGTEFIVAIDEDGVNTEIGVIDGLVSVKNLNDAVGLEVLLKTKTFTRISGTMPALPGLDMDDDYMKKWGDDFNLQQPEYKKIEFLPLINRLKSEKLIKLNSIFSGKDGFLGNKNLQQQNLKKEKKEQKFHPFQDGYLERNRANIKFNVIIGK
ncbi:FecR domain-containing protein [bacterium]|nr:FecR domain-containing protein [bacterium]